MMTMMLVNRRRGGLQGHPLSSLQFLHRQALIFVCNVRRHNVVVGCHDGDPLTCLDLLQRQALILVVNIGWQVAHSIGW